jgi:hypothetical protein
MKDAKAREVALGRGLTTYANLVFAVLWIGFALALIFNRAWMDMAWLWVQAQPLFLRVVIWILILPIMVGLWIWESSWPFWKDMLGLLGLGIWTSLALDSIGKNFFVKEK